MSTEEILENEQNEEIIEEVTEETAPEVTEETTTQEAQESEGEKYDKLNDTYLRMLAEYDNFRKRSVKERDGVRSDAIAYTVKAMLSTFDNLERAILQPTEDEAYKKGVELTFTQLNDALKSIGVTIVEDSAGTTFDPNLHNAVMHIEDEELGENVIAETFQHGFMIGDKVIRHSMVKVAN